jgi:hypothetical protein
MQHYFTRCKPVFTRRKNKHGQYILIKKKIKKIYALLKIDQLPGKYHRSKQPVLPYFCPPGKNRLTNVKSSLVRYTHDAAAPGHQAEIPGCHPAFPGGRFL